MKLSIVSVFALAVPAGAFVPSTGNGRPAFMLSMSEEGADGEVEVATPPTPPEPTPEPPAAAVAEPAGALVPVKEETVEFTAGIIGGVAGFAIGGPVLGAIAAAAANYATKTESDFGDIISNVSKTSIEIFNYLANLDAKYSVLSKTKDSLTGALDKLKAQDNVDPEVVAKVESAIDATTGKIKEVNDEYDLVGGGVTALGVVGDLVEQAVIKAGELNEEYKLSDKAGEALSTAVDKAKTAASDAIAKN